VGGPILAGAAFDHAGMSSPYWLGAAFVAVGFFLIRAAAGDQPRAEAQT
jgi:predicted MFS family arabinose efflux permease